jgi:DNA-directed RNA polymerase subunit RPC12/RpoP
MPIRGEDRCLKCGRDVVYEPPADEKVGERRRCLQCGDTFYRRIARGRPPLYCSRRCYDRAQNARKKRRAEAVTVQAGL